MGCVMVTAYLGQLSNKSRDSIYMALMERNWMKLSEPNEGLDTIWYRFFEDSGNESVDKEITLNDFKYCTRLFCKPKLAIHWGPGQPLFAGL